MKMEARLTMVMCVTLVVASMLHVSLAQTTHVVGDGMGWLVPPGEDIAYRTWAATQSFVIGDILVFNYTTGTHDVAEVSREAYDSCNSTNPMSMYTNGSTNITLTSAGEHHFICTFARHCDFGQRLAINVSVATSPTPQPQPTTPPPASAPAPSRAAMTFIVGDGLGWLVPPGGSIAYQTWASGQEFMVGDTLVFNFTTGVHDVAEVTSSEFSSCNTTSTNIMTTGPARITLTTAGEHYYICTISQHCSFGQQLAINVTGRSTVSPTPSPGSPTPSRTSTDSPGPSPNSASSFAVGVLPITFLTIVLAFLYN